MARAVASAALSATDLATQDEKDGARRPGIRGKAAGARRRPRFAVAAVAAGLALAVGMGGYAYASGQLVSVASAFDDVADQSAQVEDLVEKSELPGRVTAAVMRLSPPYREAVYLYYYEGMSIRQIARATGATEAAITKRLSRARAELRKSLEEKSDGNHDEGVSGRDGSGLSFFRKEEPDGTGRGLGRAVCD